jgi:hypothetical protein
MYCSVMPGLLRETVPNHSALPSAAAGATESLYDHLLRGRSQAEMFVIERFACFNLCRCYRIFACFDSVCLMLRLA